MPDDGSLQLELGKDVQPLALSNLGIARMAYQRMKDPANENPDLDAMLVKRFLVEANEGYDAIDPTRKISGEQVEKEVKFFSLSREEHLRAAKEGTFKLEEGYGDAYLRPEIAKEVAQHFKVLGIPVDTNRDNFITRDEILEAAKNLPNSAEKTSGVVPGK